MTCLLLAFLLSSVSVSAKEAYAEYADGTLTFYYDNLKSNRNGEVYDFSYQDSYPYKFYGWREHMYDIKHVVFNSSFAGYYPTSTSCWFYALSVEDITGMKYLDTRNVTDMSGMFFVFYVFQLRRS